MVIDIPAPMCLEIQTPEKSLSLLVVIWFLVTALKPFAYLQGMAKAKDPSRSQGPICYLFYQVQSLNPRQLLAHVFPLVLKYI